MRKSVIIDGRDATMTARAKKIEIQRERERKTEEKDEFSFSDSRIVKNVVHNKYVLHVFFSLGLPGHTDRQER